MSYIVDTNVFIFWLLGDSRLPRLYKRILEDYDETVVVSTIVPWEISIKISLRKLKVPPEYYSIINDGPFLELPITHNHVTMLQQLPSHHRDPFDRMLIAQSFVEEMQVMTVDPQFFTYGVNVLPFRDIRMESKNID